MANFNLTKMALNMFCPGNVAQLDDAGLPSILVWIPAFRLCDVLNTTDESIHPAFIVNGVQIPGFYYSKYENVVHDGKAYSLPAENPHVGVTFDSAISYCENKGYGWHISTAAEWAAIALITKKNGTLPNGNNNSGKDTSETDYKAIPATYNDDGTTAAVATGTGPLTWSHDGTAAGVWDMNGNVSEWQGGIRFVWGELQILANNDAADSDNPQNNTSVCWKAINAADGSLVDPECKTTDAAAVLSGATVRLDYAGSVWKYSTSITDATNGSRQSLFGSIACDSAIGDATKLLLRALALLPDEGATAEDYDNVLFWCNNGANLRHITRGERWTGQSAGIFFMSGSEVKTTKYDFVGFRASYIPNL